MDEENGAVGLLLGLVVVGLVLLSGMDILGFAVILVGGLLFFGAMAVAGENDDFNAVHSDW